MLQINTGQRNFSINEEDVKWFIDGQEVDAQIAAIDGNTFSLLIDGRSYTATIESLDKANKTMTIHLGGKQINMSISEPIDQLIKSMGLDMSASKKAEPIKAPMPGLVLKVLVAEGQQVHKGDNLIVLEAMKMENILKASGPATVKKIVVGEKTAVEKGAILIEME